MKSDNKKKILARIAIGGLCGLTLGITYVVLISKPLAAGKEISTWWIGRVRSENDGMRLQTSDNDCGPTALQMIFDHYNIPTTVDEIKHEVGMTKRGSTMLMLKETADRKGLHAEGWRLTMQDLSHASFPAILFVRESHFVVADSISNEDVFIRDPGIGKLRIPKAKLLQLWNGQTLIFRRK